MEERELLELAALAAGYQLQRMCDPVESGEEGSEFFHLDGRYWDPRKDDGDSMRLAVDAKISFGIGKQTGLPLVCWSVNGDIRRSEMHKDPDPPDYAESRVEWVREAIFYAATDIGRAIRWSVMPKSVPVQAHVSSRKCYIPDCWNCNGTGLDKHGFICLMQGDIPF